MNSPVLPRLVLARQLGVDPERLDPDRTLSSYGMDSLRSMELVAALEDATGRRLPESFCFDHPTLGRLADALDGMGRTTVPDTPWTADATLPDDFAVPVVGDALTARPRHVLLTGATGLLGAYLLRTLIDETDAQVWCLVRVVPGEGLTRIRANLERYHLWRDGLDRRIEIIRGDLAEPCLGLDPAEYLSVATMTDAVLHAGADVDWVHPYAALREVNVAGTLSILRLAAEARPKPVQFISSLSVCYVPDGPPVIDETTDCLPFVGRLPLGYAQTKCVAEALCQQAAGRGLPVRVVRPGLIAGDSRSGASNADDLMGRLVRGCIGMGSAPDLHWSLDALPADEVARAVVRAPWPEPVAFERIHLSSPRPRTWQECVLWINLIGYPCRLVPFEAWREQLGSDARSLAHPLSPLRAFFARGREGASPAEMCQSTRHSVAAPARARRGCPSLATLRGVDAAMLARYIEGYVADGALPAARRARPGGADRLPAWRQRGELEALLQRHFGGRVVLRAIEDVPGDATLGIISDLTSWRRGHPTGVFRQRLTIEHDHVTKPLAIVVKVKAHDDVALEAARALAALCSERLGREVQRFEDRIGLRGAGDREVALYQQSDESRRRAMPACYGAWPQTRSDGAVLVLETIADDALMDATEPSAWSDAHVDAALRGLAAVHAAGLGRCGDPLFHPMRGVADVQTMAPLWQALADHAAPYFEAAAGPALCERHASLVDSLERWTPALDASTPTLIHHDFNPRNACLRREGAGYRLCVYDWELATVGLPQRDLAELLCFVLSADVSRDRIWGLAERYRQRLVDATGHWWPADDWHEGFRAAMSLLLIDRLSFYAMIQRVRPQSFLPRVLRTWQRIDAVLSSRACPPVGG